MKLSAPIDCRSWPGNVILAAQLEMEANQLEASPGRLYFWGDRALYLGPGTPATLHAHHATQICLPLSGRVRLRPGPGTRWQQYEGALIPSNQPHESDTPVDFIVSLWIDPDTVQGRALVSGCRHGPILGVEKTKLPAIVRQLEDCWRENFDSSRAAVLVDDVVRSLARRPIDPSPVADVRVARALEFLRSASERRASIRDVAARVQLSPSRLAHLFSAGTGMPLRRYLLWLRLRDAVGELTRGTTTTEVSHAVGFADAPHMIRTFRRMLGFTPTALRHRAYS